MKELHIPEGYQAVIPYLIIRDVAGFIDFAKVVFGATEIMRHMTEDQKSIMHAEIRINGSVIMMGEASDMWPVNNAGMFVYVQDADEVYARAMQQGATSILEPNDKEYGRNCGFKDAYGNVWWPVSKSETDSKTA